MGASVLPQTDTSNDDEDESSSTISTLDEVLPSRDVIMEEARKFLAFRRVSAWKSAREDAEFAPSRQEIMSVVKLTRCRSVGLFVAPEN